MQSLMLTVSFLGSWKAILFLNILIGLYLIKIKQLKLFLVIAISSLSNLFIIDPLKILFHEARPIGAMVIEKSFSFPSGHAYSAITFYGLLTYLLYKKYKHKYIPIFGTIFIFLISYSRLYLGVHLPIDIIVGLLLGIIMLLFIIPMINNQNLLHFRHPILEIALIVLFIFSQKLNIVPVLSTLKPMTLIETLSTVTISIIVCIGIIIVTNHYPNLPIDTTKIVNHNKFPKFIPLILYPLVSVTIQEIIFRWFIIGLGQNITTSTSLIIIISSIFFGIIHLPFSKIMAFGTFTLGVWWGYLYLTTGNLWYPIISHSLIGNTLIYLALYKHNALPR